MSVSCSWMLAKPQAGTDNAFAVQRVRFACGFAIWRASTRIFMPLLRTVTLGCKVNQYETEFVREGLLGIGYEDAVEDDQAELCIVNTCTVTNEGDSKSRQAIRRLARKNPGAKIVVMGCYATRAPEDVHHDVLQEVSARRAGAVT